MNKPIIPPDPEKMNDARAEWAGACIRHFQCSTGTDFDDALADLLCDLMHWADRNGFDFEAQFRRGSTHYEAETSSCIEILVDALNEIAAGGITEERMVQIANDALESAPNARVKLDDKGIAF
jgi:hypothetical protein